MMIKPGISELQKCVDSRYTLVTMAAKRARMLGSSKENEENPIIKPVSVAVEEIADGKVGYVRHAYDRQLDTNNVYEHEAVYDADSEPEADAEPEQADGAVEAEASGEAE